MEVKGVIIQEIKEYVAEHFPLRFQEWLDSLPEEAKEIMSGNIIVGDWYPLRAAMIEPLKIMTDLFLTLIREISSLCPLTVGLGKLLISV